MIHAVKGMNDALPSAAEPFLDSAVWERILGAAHEVLSGFGFRQVLLPLVEETALFARGIGEATDIVTKEMYSFEDRGGRSLTLRPEGTAGAVRAYVEHNLGKSDPVQKWWYWGPMFRAERPQKGRYRQFYQIGAELFGTGEPTADAELLALVWRLTQALGLEGISVRINSLGDVDSRGAYREVLRAYLQERGAELCASCQARVATNPLRVLDCKREACRTVAKGAPDILASLSAASAAHFSRVQELLGVVGVPFERDARLVRGLDYYTGTIFELTTSALGAQDAILGGGRYDDLVAELGGPPTPAIGFAAGVERLALLVAQSGAVAAQRQQAPHLYIAPMPQAEARALELADAVRRMGRFRVEVDVTGARLKQMMRRADRIGAEVALVLGEDELATGRGNLKRLREGLHVGARLETVELSGPAVAKAVESVLQTSSSAAGTFEEQQRSNR